MEGREPKIQGVNKSGTSDGGERNQATSSGGAGHNKNQLVSGG